MKKSQLVEKLSSAMRFNQNLADRYDELVCKRVGITTSEFRCMDIITQRDKITAGELARDAGISPAAVTNVIDHLEERGWIERASDPDDRRRTLLRATEVAGKELFPHYQAFYENFIGELSAMKASELERWLDFYERGNEFTAAQIKKVENE